MQNETYNSICACIISSCSGVWWSLIKLVHIIIHTKWKMYRSLLWTWFLGVDVILELVKGQHSAGNCIALILARGGSKQVPRKNVISIQNVSLLKRTINVARSAEVFSEIWVSTDDIEIYKEAKLADAQVFARSAETATDTATSLDAIKEFYSFFPNVSCIALLQCTSPFQSALYLRKAYSMMKKFHYDSVFSVVNSRKLRWRKHSDNSVLPVNFDPKTRPRRQDLEAEYIENGMFYLFRTELLEYDLIQGKKIGIVEVPFGRSIEIDTYEDLDYAKYLSVSLLPIIAQENHMCWSEEESSF